MKNCNSLSALLAKDAEWKAPNNNLGYIFVGKPGCELIFKVQENLGNRNNVSGQIQVFPNRAIHIEDYLIESANSWQDKQ